MAEFSDTSHAITDSNNRCLKCVFVILEVFPKILQKIMVKTGLSGEWLYNRIQNDQHFKTKLTAEDHRVIQTLLNDGYTKLDLTLIFKIITHYSNLFINPPTRGWSSNPLPTEITIGDDAQRLRLKRNQFLHRVTNELSEKDCNEFFSEVARISERVDRFLNCTYNESFKLRIETLNSQPFVATEELKIQYDEEKCLEEYFVTEIRNHEFKVLKAKSLNNFLKDRRDHHDGSYSPITLIFPEISNPEFTEIMSNFREEINQGLVNIEVESISDGSLVMDIVVQTTVLLNDEDLKRDLITLLTRLLTIREYEEILNTLPIVTIVLSEESLACFNDYQVDIVENEATTYPKGSIQLNLRVNNNILQSEDILKSEVESLFDTLVSHSNGNTVFPIDKPVVSIIEPGFRAIRGDDNVIGTDWNKETSLQRHLKAKHEALKPEKLLESKSETHFDTIIPKLVENMFTYDKTMGICTDVSQKSYTAQSDSDKALNTTTKEPENQNREAQVKVESLNLQLVNRFDIGTLPLLYKRIRCCTLPNGLMVFTGDDYVYTLLITKSDGTLQSTINLPLDHTHCNCDITSTGGNCVALSSFHSHVILITDVIKEEIVKRIKTNHRPSSITFKEGHIFYCGYPGYIVKLDIDNGNERSDESDLLIKRHKGEGHFKDSGRKNYQHTHGNFPYVLAEEQIVCRDSRINPLSRIASSNDRICYSDKNDTVTVLDSKYNIIYKCEELHINPTDLTIDHDGVVYIISSSCKNISAITPNGKTVRKIFGKDGEIIDPSCVHYDRYTQQLIVVDKESVIRYSINMS